MCVGFVEFIVPESLLKNVARLECCRIFRNVRYRVIKKTDLA